MLHVEDDRPVVAFVIGFLLREFAEEVVEPGVDNPDPVDVVQRRFRVLEQRLKDTRSSR